MTPIIDTHQHLWDLNQFNLPWLKSCPPLQRSFTLEDYRQATEHLPVERTIYMEVDVEPGQRRAEAEHVIRLCQAKDNPMAGAIIAGDPRADDFDDYITSFANSPEVKGVRRVLHGQPAGTCLDPAFVKGVQRLGELNLTFDLCLRPGELADGARLVEQCPKTQFVLDHCGNASVAAFRPGADNELQAQARQWRRDIDALADHPHVACKISGIIANAGEQWTVDDLEPIVDYCLDAFGPDRVVFGGDWPVCLLGAPLRDWISALQKIVSTRARTTQQKLYHDNAIRIYNLA